MTPLSPPTSYYSDPLRKEQVALMREASQIIQQVYKNQEAYQEVNAAIYSRFERDEGISIQNLLNLGSRLYQHKSFRNRPVKFGAFSAEFKKIYSQGSYPQLAKYYEKLLSIPEIQTSSSGLPPETWLINNIRIYFPYSDNWASLCDPGSPHINTLPGLVLVTTCDADREEDFGPGLERYVYMGNRTSPREIRVRTVTVDDNYAETIKPVHIFNIMDIMDDPPPPVPPITGVTLYKVSVGWVRVNDKQFDKLLSINNGGGPELRFGRGYAVVDGGGNVVTGFPFFHGPDITRKDCRKKYWKQVATVWDQNWSVGKVEQGFAIWEWDNDDDDGTISANVGYSNNGVTTTTTVSSTYQSKDAVIRNMGMDRNYYFSQGHLNQGGGMWENWPVWDHNQQVSYTLPYQVIN